MDEDTAELLQAISEELEYYIASDEPGIALDSTDAERLVTEAQQVIYDHECSKVDLVDGRPKPTVLRGYI